MLHSTRLTILAGAGLCAATLGLLAPSLLAQSQRARERAAARSRVAATAGEVLLNEKVVMRLRSKAGSLTPAQRADRVARRLDALSGAGKLNAAELQVRNVPAGAALYAGKELIVTADRQEAKASGLPPRRLAESWRDNLSTALVGRPVAYRQDPTPVTARENQARAAAVEPEPELKNKLVPILTFGSSGSIGIAQVTGPEERVREVKAVVHFNTDYKDRARIRMLVPIHTENIVQNLKRVPQVAVTGIGDVRF